MITTEKVIQNLQEIKNFCNAQQKCQTCPFIRHYYMGSCCAIKESMQDWNDDILSPSSWNMEEF